MENKKHYLFEIKCINEKGGCLSVLEADKNIPFKIKRVFYEYNVSNQLSRGEHANKKSQFCMIALSGFCEVVVNDGDCETVYLLDSPTKVLYMDRMVWKIMKNFSDNCILLVLSDSLYDQGEYIRDFQQYLKQISLTNNK